LREKGYALVTEGYMDVVALAQLGFPNAVATLGTACTPDHVQKLFRFTDAVVFSFDGDGAGRRAARKALDGALSYASDVRSIKFLFLPEEHDPDSFIRAHGSEAFAQAVATATPLSRFLVEAASEGCDLHSAEGRAHLSSNAKPLWSALPQGALKLQLLGEIADLVQLNSRELSQLWLPGQGNEGGAARKGEKSAKPRGSWDGAAPGTRPWSPSGARSRVPTRAGLRAQPASRAEHAARILLAQSHLWAGLSNEDQAMLCEQPAPLAQLFVWLESQLHEHGPLNWTALRGELTDQEFADLALRLMGGATVPSEHSEEAALDLRDVLQRLCIDRLTAEMTVIAAQVADPEVRQRYRTLETRKKALIEELESVKLV
jgi:DNA primase